ncbi:MAG: DUF3883 domain-containing protein, partial [Flavobacteriaceae bacterium]
AWSALEVETIVPVYFEMLRKELRGEKFNKSAYRRNLSLKLLERSEGAIEYKHQNISAVLAKHDLLYIVGYQPGFDRTQQLLEREILNYLESHPDVYDLFDQFLRNPRDLETKKVVFHKWKKEPPKSQDLKENEPVYKKKSKSKRNYLEEEQRNHSIGQKGEQLVYDYEVWRLKNSSNPELADQVQWISQENDAAGFDILSKETDGSDRYIEVKTTTLGKKTPIFFSQNENAFSQAHSRQFYLYRVFDLRKNPRLFIVQGRFERFCRMEVVGYKGWF